MSNPKHPADLLRLSDDERSALDDCAAIAGVPVGETPASLDDMTFARNTLNASQGQQCDGFPNLNYLDVTVSIRDEWLCSMAGFVTKEVAALVLAAPDLFALAKQYASECAECSGRGFVHGDDGVSGCGPDDVEPTRHECTDCADIRAVIAKAEGRS